MVRVSLFLSFLANAFDGDGGGGDAALVYLYGGLAAVAIRIDPTYFVVVLYLRGSILYTSLPPSRCFCLYFFPYSPEIESTLIILTRFLLLKIPRYDPHIFLTRSFLS